MVPLASLVNVTPNLRAGPRHALQRLSGRRNQRRSRAGFQLRPGEGGDANIMRQKPAARHEL